MAQNVRAEIVRDAPKVGRTQRSPAHTFGLWLEPFVIQPCLIAPVWPGETMANALIQAKVEGPIVPAINQGWWFEYYLFYVKHRDMAARDQIMAMHLDQTADISGLASGWDPFTYHKSGINWTRMCLNAVVDQYFRDEGTDHTDFVHPAYNLPLASINGDNWMDSLILDSDVTPIGDNAEEGLPGEHPVVPDGVPAEFAPYYDMWQRMRNEQMTAATFEDYLKSFGVRPAKELRVEEINKPELLRYMRDWQYPQVGYDQENATSGFIPRWKIAERADKDRFFAEPGFIFGCCVVRPKQYMGHQMGSAVSVMDDAYSWLPAVLLDQPYTSLKKITADSGTLADVAVLADFNDVAQNGPIVSEEDYWFDLRDIAVHGDQFLNRSPLVVGDAPGSGGVLGNEANTFGCVALPAPDTLQRQFVQIDPAATPIDYADAFKVDGIVQFTIKSRIADTSL